VHSAFGSRLFRLFLLFALVPAVVLVTVGYYLAVEPGLERGPADDAVVARLHEQYGALLDSTITAILGQPNAREILESQGFFMLFAGGKVQSVWTQREVVHEVAAPVARAVASGRDHGTAPVGERLYRYASIRRGDTLLVGGLAHSPEFAALLESYRGVRADESAAPGLHTRYAVFLALLFGLVAAATVGLAYVFSSRLARHLARPVAELDRAARQIAAGQFGITVAEQGVGEIRALIGQFNAMSQQLASATARLVQAERVAAWQHVARRFAHELINPLQPITVSVYQIRKALSGTPSFELVQRPLDAVAEELQHLTVLADRFSRLAKLPAPRLETVDLRAHLTSVADLYRGKLAGFAFTLELPEEPVAAAIDPTYFREAIHNLLQNAIEATPPGGRISLRLEAGPDGAVIAVEDAGRGMSAEVAREARLPYFTTRPHGTGLGLAIVEKTVSEHGGRLEVRSVENRGTTVTIVLPHAGEPHDA